MKQIIPIFLLTILCAFGNHSESLSRVSGTYIKTYGKDAEERLSIFPNGTYEQSLSRPGRKTVTRGTWKMDGVTISFHETHLNGVASPSPEAFKNRGAEWIDSKGNRGLAFDFTHEYVLNHLQNKSPVEPSDDALSLRSQARDQKDKNNSEPSGSPKAR